MDAKRDWGHAKDYVEMQWLMLQQDKPEDFVIATGVQYSVRDFVNAAAKELGIEIRWEGQGVDEKGYWINCYSREGGNPAQSDTPIVAVDPRYFRPTEVETLLGDPAKAKAKLGWTPKITFDELVSEMVREDLKAAERDELVLTCRSLATFDPLGIPARCVANPRHSWAMAAVRALRSWRQAPLGANADFCK